MGWLSCIGRILREKKVYFGSFLELSKLVCIILCGAKIDLKKSDKKKEYDPDI